MSQSHSNPPAPVGAPIPAWTTWTGLEDAAPLRQASWTFRTLGAEGSWRDGSLGRAAWGEPLTEVSWTMAALSGDKPRAGRPPWSEAADNCLLHFSTGTAVRRAALSQEGRVGWAHKLVKQGPPCSHTQLLSERLRKGQGGLNSLLPTVSEPKQSKVQSYKVSEKSTKIHLKRNWALTWNDTNMLFK